MNKTLTLALAIAPALLRAQSYGISVVWDIRTKAVAPVATVQLGTIRNVLGKGIDLDVLGFAGVRTQRGRGPVGTGGIALAYNLRLADNVWATAGAAGRVEAGLPSVSGILAGIAIRF